jgi:hypothetical protein
MVYVRTIFTVKLGRKSFYSSAPHPFGSSAAVSASRLLDEVLILGLVAFGQGCVRLRKEYAAHAEAIANLLCAMQAVDAELSSIGEIECEPLVRGYPTVRRYWTERKAPHARPVHCAGLVRLWAVLRSRPAGSHRSAPLPAHPGRGFTRLATAEGLEPAPGLPPCGVEGSVRNLNTPGGWNGTETSPEAVHPRV